MPISNPGVMPAASLLVVAETEVFNAVSPNPEAWTDLNLSAVIGAQASEVMLKFGNTGITNNKTIYVRRNGDTDNPEIDQDASCGIHCVELDTNKYGMVKIDTDGAGIIEWKCDVVNEVITIDVLTHLEPA